MIKVAIIGAGAIANAHIESFLTFPERCKIVALVDIYPEKAKEKIQDFGLDAAAYADYKELIKDVDFDLASICLPPFAHAEVTIDMLNAGKHVMTEKPMATSLEECDAMIAAADKNNRLLSVVAQNRFRTPLMKLKKILESGLVGKIVHARIDSYWWRGDNYYDLWWRGTWEKEGGGCTMNHAVHHIDLFHWLMGGMPAELQGTITNIAHTNSEVEDFSTAVMRYDNGAIAQVTASLVHHGEDQKFIFQGEHASVAIPWDVKANVPLENGFPTDNPELSQQLKERFDTLADLTYTEHTGQVDNVLSAIEGSGDLLIDGREGRKTLELVMAIYQSGTTSDKVSLPLTSADPFYTRQGVLDNAPRFYEKTKSVENFATEDITFGSDYEADEED